LTESAKTEFTTSFKEEYEVRRELLEDPIEASNNAMAFARGKVLEVIRGSRVAGDVVSAGANGAVGKFKATVVGWAVEESGEFLDNDIISELKGFLEEQGVPRMLLGKGMELVRNKIIAKIEFWVGSMIDMLVTTANDGDGEGGQGSNEVRDPLPSPKGWKNVDAES